MSSTRIFWESFVLGWKTSNTLEDIPVVYHSREACLPPSEHYYSVPCDIGELRYHLLDPKKKECHWTHYRGVSVEDFQVEFTSGDNCPYREDMTVLTTPNTNYNWCCRYRAESSHLISQGSFPLPQMYIHYIDGLHVPHDLERVCYGGYNVTEYLTKTGQKTYSSVPCTLKQLKNTKPLRQTFAGRTGWLFNSKREIVLASVEENYEIESLPLGIETRAGLWCCHTQGMTMDSLEKQKTKFFKRDEL
jgi:hypothetical protein